MIKNNYKSDFINVMHERGFIHQGTDLSNLDLILDKNSISGYIGFDCTAKSLHIGSLVQIMMLRWFQKTGNKPIILLGGSTTKIGDPTGRDSIRTMLDDYTISENITGISRVFDKLIKFGNNSTDAIIVNNSDWFNCVGYIEFLRDYGRYFSVNRMLSFESVKSRLNREQPMSFLEFNYMILQAYDFLELSRRHNCILQMGGSDQWGNIINGVELGRRIDNRALFGLTSPLITLASGQKMGKTSSGAVWLNDDMTSAYEYWQFWRNISDSDVGRFLKLFTDLPLDEISRLESLGGTEINEAKKILAYETTKMVHGNNMALSAANTAEKTFEEGVIGDDLQIIIIPYDELCVGIAAFELFSKTGLVSSRNEARKIIRGGGARLNNKKIENEHSKITLDDMLNDHIKLSVGKKKHIIIKTNSRNDIL